MRIALYGLICSVVMLGGCQSSSEAWLEKGHWLIADDGGLLLAYNQKNTTYKPYVVELFTPAGVNVLRDQVPDHLHHHGLMMALNINDINFWEETAGAGYQVTQTFGGQADGSLAGELQWMDAARAVTVLNEKRDIKSYRVPKCEAALTTWTSVCSVPAGQTSMRVAGQHYYGLGMRFVQSMDNNGEFVYAGRVPGPIFRGMSG